MQEPFSELRERLLHAGVAPRHVRRYVKELREHLADLTAEEAQAGSTRAESETRAVARLGSVDNLAKAMIDQRQFRSWCTRAPWAVFSVAPVFGLAAAYVVACQFLFFGWKLFLPTAATPFVRIPGPVYGSENIYFQVGRMIFFGAPIVIGGAIGLVAARQRTKSTWPFVGLGLVALLSSSAQVQAYRATVTTSGGNINKGIVLGPGLTRARGFLDLLFFLCLTALPYLIWRLRNRSTIAE